MPLQAAQDARRLVVAERWGVESLTSSMGSELLSVRDVDGAQPPRRVKNAPGRSGTIAKITTVAPE